MGLGKIPIIFEDIKKTKQEDLLKLLDDASKSCKMVNEAEFAKIREEECLAFIEE